MRIICLFLACTALWASTLRATSPLYKPVYGDNTLAYSSDGVYCVEIYQPLGLGGCRTPPLGRYGWIDRDPRMHTHARTYPELIEIARKKDSRPLDVQLAEFDGRGRTAVLHRLNKDHEYVRVSEFRVQPTAHVVLSTRGDLLTLPMANDSEFPTANIDLYNASGKQIAKVAFKQLLEEAGSSFESRGRPRSGKWALRIDEKPRHRIIVLSIGPLGAGLPDIEYDADARKLKAGWIQP